MGGFVHIMGGFVHICAYYGASLWGWVSGGGGWEDF